MKYPVGSTVVKTQFSTASGIAYRYYRLQFPDIVCLCHYSTNVQWIIDTYINDSRIQDLVFIYNKNNPLEYTIAYLCDLYLIEGPPSADSEKTPKTSITETHDMGNINSTTN